MISLRRAAPALLLVLAAGIARAAVAAPVTIRAGDHGGFGRLVLDLPPGVSAQQSVNGDQVLLHFSAPVQLLIPSELPRNVRAVDTDGPDGAILTLAPRSRPRITRARDRLVIDASDAPRSERHRQLTPQPADMIAPTLAVEPKGRAVAPASTPPQQAHPPGLPIATATLPTPLPEPKSPVVSPPRSDAIGPAPPSVTPAASVERPLATPSSRMMASSPSLALAATPSGASGTVVDLPFDPQVGAAALARGGVVLVVFDRPKPLDLAALRQQPAFAGATVDVLPASTVLTLHPPTGFHARLSATQDGWRVTLEATPGTPEPIAARPFKGGLEIAVGQPSRVVAIPDPLSGGALLIGTVRQGRDAVSDARLAPEFALLPTITGVAVEPLSDRLQLAVSHEGFTLAGAGGPLALTPDVLPARLAARTAGLTRRFGFPDQAEDALRALATEQRATVAATPPLGRGSGRVKLARTLLSLGLDQEALGVLRTAAAADPRLANDPDVIGLEAVASVLAFRPEEAAGLSDPRLAGSDEIALWRALRDAQTNAAPQQLAPILATTAPLLLEAPTAIRRALLPLALETMIAGGQAKAAEPILAARPEDVKLGLARAMAEEAAGNNDAALAAYDAITAGRDRLAHFRAAMRAADLRLALGKLTPAQAAEALERLDAGWRGDRYELSRRERLAELRVAAGEWRAAFSGLREAEVLFPEASSELHARVQDTVDKLFAKDATRALPPLDFVALLNENADVLGAAVTRSDLQQRLADRLLALDLPDAAVPLLRRLVAAEPEGPGRAATGAKLASLLLAGGDAAGAIAALDASKAATLSSDITTNRAVLAARATNARGDAKGAILMLEGLSGDEPEVARADIAEQAGDYPTAITALQAILGRAAPAEPITGKTERTLLRLATDASRVGNESLLAELRNQDLPKLGKDADADTIRLLLAAPVQRMADLPRASKEAALAGVVAAGLRGTAPAR